MRTLATIGIVAFVALGLVAEEQTPTGVCNVVTTPEAYASSMLSIKGTVISSEDRVVLVCDKPSARTIRISFPDEDTVKNDPLFKAQKLAFHRSKTSDRFIEYLLQQCSERIFSATVRGYFQYRKRAGGEREGRFIVTDVDDVQGEPCEVPTF